MEIYERQIIGGIIISPNEISYAPKFKKVKVRCSEMEVTFSLKRKIGGCRNLESVIIYKKLLYVQYLRAYQPAG